MIARTPNPPHSCPCQPSLLILLQKTCLGDRLGEALDTGLGKGIVDLSCIAVQTRGRGDVDDALWRPVLLSQVRCGGTDDPEGTGTVAGEHGVPLFVRHLVNHTVVGKAGIVDDDVDLAKLLHSLVDETLGKVGVHDISTDRDGLCAGAVDLVDDLLCLF